MAKQEETKQEEAKQHFEIQRIYVKDASLESPESPKIFLEQWEPETHVDLHVGHEDLKNKLYEVILRLTVTVKHKEKSIMIAEVKQAAIFHIEGFNEEQMEHMLRAYCPNILFPYGREVIAALSNRATFPPINLAPINFDALYMQQKEQEAKEKS